MREFLVIAGLLIAASAAPLSPCELNTKTCDECERNTNWLHVLQPSFSSQAGPVKISDNNIENIFNININIQGVFTNNIEQDIISVVVGLLNQQGITAGGSETLKDQLMALAQKSDSRNLDVNIPASSLGQKFNFDGLANKIQEAIAKKGDNPAPQTSASSAGSLEAQARDLFQKYMANSQQLKE